MSSREAIPADIERAVKLEAGGRCAIPRCGYPLIEMAHIVPYSEVKEHTFGNIIALCPNCHTGYDNRNMLDRKAMIQLKRQLAELNSRYGEYERRLLDRFAIVRHGPLRATETMRSIYGDLTGAALREAMMSDIESQNPRWEEQDWQRVNLLASAATAIRSGLMPRPCIDIVNGMDLLVYRLETDGYLARGEDSPLNIVTSMYPMFVRFRLTERGAEFVDEWSSPETLKFINR